MKVSVFGAANAKPGDASYEEAYRLGKMLGEAGHTVLTGGYIGMMEAASRGAHDAGSHVVGVTCEEIEAWRGVQPNDWVKEEWRYTTLHERLIGLLDGCDAGIALPGGVGTMAEILMMWNRLLVKALDPKPCIVIGEGWRQVFDCLHANLGQFIKEDDWEWLQFVPDAESAVSLLNNHQPGKSG